MGFKEEFKCSNFGFNYESRKELYTPLVRFYFIFYGSRQKATQEKMRPKINDTRHPFTDVINMGIPKKNIEIKSKNILSLLPKTKLFEFNSIILIFDSVSLHWHCS